jgi:hypothetical protein
MAERGRIGAEVSKQVRRKGKGLRPGELGPLRTPQDAERWLRIVGQAVAEGRLRNRDADSTTRAVREWLRAHDAGEVAHRLNGPPVRAEGIDLSNLAEEELNTLERILRTAWVWIGKHLGMFTERTGAGSRPGVTKISVVTADENGARRGSRR